MHAVSLARDLWRFMGPRWLLFRLRYAARMRFGMMERQLPVTEWSEQPLVEFLKDGAAFSADEWLTSRRNASPHFYFDARDFASWQPWLKKWDAASEGQPQDIVENAKNGQWPFFHQLNVLAPFPPEWRTNPLSRRTVTTKQHWTQISEKDYGDIKLVWEASRFSLTYAFVRAYAREGAGHFAESFWQLVEDWYVNNPPQQGPNWKCGQETSFRVMAWCFGFYGFLHAEETSPARAATMLHMLALSGQRIEANLDYALSQQNNHGISEAVGLWTIGLLFPELKDANRWRKLGRKALIDQARTLIYDDGSFAQHSANYHRVMLHDCIWALRLDQLHDNELSELLPRVIAATNWLYAIMETESGNVPNLGQNDGAMVLPLSNCGADDYRPVVQAAAHLRGTEPYFLPGPWNETSLWLFGIDHVDKQAAPVPQSYWAAPIGGYYTLRGDNTFALVRNAKFRHRPSQADQLHVDLWQDGENIAVDAGTYSYHAPEPWTNPFAESAYHNTVTINGLDQMRRRSKFLWLPWCEGVSQPLRESPTKQILFWQGEHNGYMSLPEKVTHRRALILLAKRYWLVIDQLVGQQEFTARLQWLLKTTESDWQPETNRLRTPSFTLSMAGTPGSMSKVVADPNSPRGWQSPSYMVRQPATSFAYVATGRSIHWISAFSQDPFQLTESETTLSAMNSSITSTIHWTSAEAKTVVKLISLQTPDHTEEFYI